MSIQRLSRFVPIAAVASLMIIILFGGCPVAQQPTTPADEQERIEPPDAPEPDGDLDRPIPPPDLDGDDDQDEPDGGDIAGGDGDDGGGGGGTDDGGVGSASITVDEPGGDLAVRAGALVAVEFAVFDYQGALVSVELVLARDDDADHQPDGPTVLDKPLSFQTGSNIYSFDTSEVEQKGLLNNGFARLLVGIRYETVDAQKKTTYASGSLSIDNQPPAFQWVSPSQDLLLSRSAELDVSLSTTDNRPVTVKVLLDPDQTVANGNEWTLISNTELPAGTNVPLNSTVSLQSFPSGNYFYYVTVSDGVDPAEGGYAETQGTPRQLGLTDRLIGNFALDQLTNSDKGAILQGFNFNDLAGSAIDTVPDLNGDGSDELIIVSRFGKPYFIETDGVGFGEAYMIYGSSGRLSGVQKLNAVGRPGDIPGLVFPGIRNPLNTKYTEGLSDVCVVPDMDGDDLPEIVFCFPRVESITLGVNHGAFQHPELFPDEPGMGGYEYDAVDYMGPSWIPNKAQFGRGGIVLVSSHNEMLTNPAQWSRKFDRVLDLHEVGQMFSWMTKASLAPYIRKVVPNDPFLNCANCIPEVPDGCVCGDPNNPCDEGCEDCGGTPDNPDETEYESWVSSDGSPLGGVAWDCWLGGG
jgi:hypothetical protein